MKVRKAVFPVAGLGTRFLPATKAMAKEMLPIVDKPLIQYAVEEAYASGIKEIIFVTGAGKNAIENHFDHSCELEHMLMARGKDAELKALHSLDPGVRLDYLHAPEPAVRDWAMPSGVPGTSWATNPLPSCWRTTW
jgi:UTP-glucose-1-phosphate uridylyltransferase